MDNRVAQLVEMGATAAQARAALTRYKDVHQAAERIFEGDFDNLAGDTQRPEPSSQHSSQHSLEAASDNEMMDEDGEDAEDYGYYDSDEDIVAKPPLIVGNSDPYAGVFFSKDRREDVIEVDEDPETALVPGFAKKLPLMLQGEFMRGCPEKGEQSFLFSLYAVLSEGECKCPHGCGETVARKKSDFLAIFPDFNSYTAHVQRVVSRTCRRCNKKYCLACGESTQAEGSQSTPRDPLFHCANLQGVILGVGLFMLDRLFEAQTSGARSTDGPQAKKRKTSHVKDSSNYDDLVIANASCHKKGAPEGTGYAGAAKEDLSWQREAQASQRAKDTTMSNLFQSVREYLPTLHREAGSCASDFLVHPTALAHLRRRFNRICSILLRNDSLSDMSDRSILYLELFEWLATISRHEALASMMAMPIMTVHSRKAGSRPNEKIVTYEGSASPRELLESTVIQAESAKRGLEAAITAELVLDNDMTEEEKRKSHNNTKGKEKAVSISDENQTLLAFCEKILETKVAIDRSLVETKGEAFVKRLNESLPKIPDSRSANYGNILHLPSNASDDDIQKMYVQWATRIRFEYCDLSIPPASGEGNGNTSNESSGWKSAFSNDAKMLINSDLPRRSLAIAKELAVLTTNLPVAWNSSIFLRVDESRVDIIKALIIGPEGTPYQNGCFLFDIFLGASYNQAPPNVKYMTTNGGKFRFNPNLYAEGKVCLSLLGTWSGPGWVPGKSTLLQVLISIQSMILCSEPYLNEPGWANSAGTKESKAYSANIRRMVIHTAMLEQIQNPPEPFDDVIRTHFKLKSRAVCKQLDEWLELDEKSATEHARGFALPGGERSVNGKTVKADIEMIKKLLRAL